VLLIKYLEVELTPSGQRQWQLRFIVYIRLSVEEGADHDVTSDLSKRGYRRLAVSTDPMGQRDGLRRVEDDCGVQSLS